MGIPGATLGAYLTELVNVHVLLAVTAVLIALSAVRVIGSSEPHDARGAEDAAPWKLGLVGGTAGVLSGLLGIGGGIIMVPAFTAWIRMPVRQALGTSLLVIPALAIPGTIVHGLLGNVDWAIFLVLTVGVIPGARIAPGSRSAFANGGCASPSACSCSVAVAYGIAELTALAGTVGRMARPIMRRLSPLVLVLVCLLALPAPATSAQELPSVRLIARRRPGAAPPRPSPPRLSPPSPSRAPVGPSSSCGSAPRTSGPSARRPRDRRRSTRGS